MRSMEYFYDWDGHESVWEESVISHKEVSHLEDKIDIPVQIDIQSIS